MAALSEIDQLMDGAIGRVTNTFSSRRSEAMTRPTRHLAVLLASAAAAAAAQQSPLPKELSGRYCVVGMTISEEFSLKDLEADSYTAFKARFTWCARDTSCAIRSQPLAGRLTPTGIAFDATTKCNVPLTAELDRSDKGWVVMAASTAGPPIALELKAN